MASSYSAATTDLHGERSNYHLTPHYRNKLPIESMLLKVQPGFDQFITEKYAQQISAVLAQWSSSLLKSSRDLQIIEQAFMPDFNGASLRPLESRLLRSRPPLEIRSNRFPEQYDLDRGAFLKQLQTVWQHFSAIYTAEFQVTSIDVDIPVLRTRVRYELVSSGADFYREQRVGEWELEWQAGAGEQFRIRKWRALAETQSRSTAPVFVDVAAEALGRNSSYFSQLLYGADYWRTVLDGACGIDVYGHNGVSVGDIDGEGLDSLYVCQPAGLPNRLYRNRGDGTFDDITDSAGVGVLENTACALFADINNDGRQDLIIVRTSGPLLFLNEGGGKFRQKPNAFQFAQQPQGTFTGAALADYDRDGWLDIYFCLYIYYQGTEQYKYPLPYYAAENGPPNFLMRNNRDGTFRDATAETGLDRNNTRYSFCCAWNDYNQDGWPDLYVVNDFGRKNLYRNNGDGTFTDVAADAGVEDVGAGMSVCWFDYDNDGSEDLYVGDMWTAAGERISNQPMFQKDAPPQVRSLYRKHAMGNSLFHGDAKQRFSDATTAAGVGMGRWSWSSDAWDFDHDGFADIYVTNGMVSGPSRDDLNSFFWRQVVGNSPLAGKPSTEYEQGWSAVNELLRSDVSWSGYERNLVYANNGDGSFSDVSGAVGLDFLEDGRAFALADFDRDGRLEVFLKNRNGPQLRLLKNVITQLPPSIAFRLRGTKSNRDAIGAVVTIQTDKGRQIRTVQAGSGFLSQHTKDVFFGLGSAVGPIRATIRWPSGLVQEIQDVPANHRIWIEEGSAPLRMEAFRETAARSPLKAQPQAPDPDSNSIETWLLAPIAAPEILLADGAPASLAAFRGKPLLLNFSSFESSNWREQWDLLQRLHARARGSLQVLMVNVDGPGKSAEVRAIAQTSKFPTIIASDDTIAVYNILYRYLFDRHRDLGLPTSFLINDAGEIIKVYQGPIYPDRVDQDLRDIPHTGAERMTKALPFRGITDTTNFRRNYLSYGSVYFQRGYFEQSEASFRRALADDPQSAEALYGVGSALLQQGNNGEARESFEGAVKLNASYPDTLPNAWNNLGLLATREGKTSDAVAYFEQALRLSPDHVVALVNLGNAYRQLKQWDDARRPLEHAVELSPEDPEANYGLAMVFAQTGDTDHAYEYLRRALKARPDYPEALNNLAILYLRTERRDEAVATFEKCIQISPPFDQAYLNLARVYALEGNPQKARATLMELLKQHPGHEQAQQMLAQLP